jgi:hypothetical protein
MGRGHAEQPLEKETAMPIIKGFELLKNLPEEKLTDQITRRVLAGDKGMIVWWSMKAGAHAAAHSHPHEQSVWPPGSAPSAGCAAPGPSRSSPAASSTRRGFPRTRR